MGLSNDLLSQFAKLTNNKPKKSTETTVYGTVKAHGDGLYIQLDGSELLTPVATTASYKVGERVAVQIKNHTATVTGNLTSPSARNADVVEVKDKVVKAEEILAKVVTADILDVKKATIDNLIADNADIKGTLTAQDGYIKDLQADNADIKGTLTAQSGEIGTLKTDNLEIKESLSAANAIIYNLDATYAKIDKLTAAEARIGNLEADHVSTSELDAVLGRIGTLESEYVKTSTLVAGYATIDNLNAAVGRIGTLESDYATVNTLLTAHEGVIKTLNSTYATIADLNAAKATIGDLDADVADINTLMFGSATGSTIQTSFANAVVQQIGNAQIKSAMIDTVSASKITALNLLAGTINSKNVTIESEDGNLAIADETIQISDDTRVRVQIGKDASGDYSINIWDAEGKLMFSEGGLTENAVKDAIIRNDMVASDAAIDAGKLDIDSLFEEINDSSKTIKSSKVYLDKEKQTLDVAFTSITTDVTNLGTTVSSQGTAISVIQGQITSKIWQQDIDTATDAMSTQYSTLEQELGLFKTTVGSTYATIEDFNSLEIGGRNLILNSSTILMNDSDDSNSNCSIIEEDYVVIIPKNDGNIYNNGGIKTSIPRKQGVEYTLSFEVLTPTKIGFYWYPNEHYTKNHYIPASESWQKVKFTYTQTGADSTNGFLFGFNGLTAGETYYYRNLKLETGNMATAWTPAPEDLELDVSSLAERLLTAETTIEQNTADILLRASKTEVATAKSEAISSANQNTNDLLKNYSTTSQMNAAINLKADGITSVVSQTYTTKAEFADLTIGGRNLFSGYDDSEFELPSYRDTGSFKQFSNLTIDAADYVGKEFTISFWAKSPNGTTPLELYNRNGDPRYFIFNTLLDSALGDEWEYYSHTFTNVDRGETYTAVHNRIEIYAPNQKGVMVKKIKVEMGNKPTDWTPAPEDISDRIDSAERNILTVSQTATDLTARLETVEHTGTDYMNFSSKGLIVGDMIADTLGNNVLIESDNVNIRDGETVLSRFGIKRYANGNHKHIIELGIDAELSEISLCGKGTISVYEYGKNSEALDIYSSGAFNIRGDRLYLSNDYASIQLSQTANAYTGEYQPSGYIKLSVDGNNEDYSQTGKASLTLMPMSLSTLEVDNGFNITTGSHLGLYVGPLDQETNKREGSLNIKSRELELDTDYLKTYVDTVIGGDLEISGDIYLPHNKKIYSYNSGGALRNLMNLSTDNNLVIGYSGWFTLEGATNLYGNKVNIFSNGDITMKSNTIFDTGIYLPNHVCIYGRNKGDTAYRRLIELDANDAVAIGYDSYAASEGSTAIFGNNINLTYKGSLKANGIAINASMTTDSGWITPASMNSDFYIYNGTDRPRYRKIGAMVNVVGAVKPAHANLTGNDTAVTIFNLPAGYRPAQQVTTLCQGSARSVWLCTINTNGNVMFSRYRKDDSGWVAPGTNSWLTFNVTFFT